MNRREFLGTAAAALAAAKASGQNKPGDFYTQLVKAAEQQAEKLLPRQQPDGGLLDQYDLPVPHATAGFISSLAAVFAAPESRLHRSAELLPPMERAAAALRRMQHADGTIDLPSTNFGSPPDTAFVIEPVCATAEVLRARGYGETAKLQRELEGFIRAAGGALMNGGIHTANHRWVVVAALARCHHLLPDQRYLRRIDEWLAEGVDIDKHFQYAERSTGVYNAVCDNSFVTAARLLNRPALLDPVRSNLLAMVYYLRPNGEVCTEISGRQDRFMPATLRPYYRAYRYMSRLDGNGAFAAVADNIEREYGASLAGELIYIEETPELRGDPTAPVPLPADFSQVFADYGFAHIRRGSWDATLLADHPRFFSFRSGSAVLEAVRLASAFFGKGQFVGRATWNEAAKQYMMAQELDADYLQPLEPEKRGTEFYASRPGRRRSNIFHLTTQVKLQEQAKGFVLAFDVHGTDRVPVAIELTFRPGGELGGENFQPLREPAGAYLLGYGGYATYRVGDHAIRISPGARAHGWTQLRGAEPRLEGLTLYLTGFTPFKHLLEIQAL